MTNAGIDPRLTAIDDCLYRISVKAIIVHEQKILLVKEEGDEWCSVPGGGIDYGETPQEALQRELIEELGVPLGSIVISPSVLDVQVGPILNGVPKANLFYHVSVPMNAITDTKHVKAHGWYTLGEIQELYTSPSTGNLTKQLRTIL